MLLIPNISKLTHSKCKIEIDLDMQQTYFHYFFDFNVLVDSEVTLKVFVEEEAESDYLPY